MATKFFLNGTTINIANLNDDTTYDALPPQVYSIGVDAFGGMFLNIIEKRMEVPPTVYGKTMDRVNKVINTYSTRTKSTGVLLTGTKGSGKTLISALVANALLDQGKPVILINTPLAGEGFTNFINSCGECVLIFDEFAKTYSNIEGDSYQDTLLTLFDGSGARKRLIILAENHEHMINEFFLNRPGRIYYHFRYGKLDEDSVNDYCAECNLPAASVEEILEVSRSMRTFSFDILKAIVEEAIRYPDISITDTVLDLNIDYDPNNVERLQVKKIICNKTQAENEVLLESMFVDKPTRGSTRIFFKASAPTTKGKIRSRGGDILASSEENEPVYTYISINYLEYEKGNTLIYKNEDYTVVCELQAPVYSAVNKYAV